MNVVLQRLARTLFDRHNKPCFCCCSRTSAIANSAKMRKLVFLNAIE